MDVTAGLAWAFQEAGCDTSVYMHLSLLGLRSVMDSWLTGELLPRDRIEEDQEKYDVLVLATFPEGPEYQERQRRLLLSRPPHQRILLGVHNPGWLLTAAWPGAPQLLAQLAFPKSPAGGGRAGAGQQQAPPPPVQLLSLAPIGSAYLKALLEGWLAAAQRREPQLAGLAPRLEVPWIVPLVPWAPTDAAGRGSSAGAGSAAEQGHEVPLRHLCIQGTIDQKRRDYAGAFAAAAHPAVLAQLRARNESLLLVGSKKNASMPVPPELEPYVRVLSSLRYVDYYDTLSRCRAILTAFGSDQYLVNKTSSTLAVALQVGAPVLTEDRVLAAYEYVPQASAFLYVPRNGMAQPDAAGMGKAEGRRLAQWTRQQAAERARQRDGVVMRRLGELLRSSEAAQQQRKEDTEAAARLPAWALANHRQQQQPRRQQPEQGPQELASPGGKAAAIQQAEDGGPPEPPPAGSYAAALLHAFDDDAARAAHAAAWRAKRAAMQRNAETARQVLREAAALATAVRAGG